MFPVNAIHEKAARAGLEYLIIGGHAINAYCEPRATLDVDFLVRRDDLPGWKKLLEADGFKLFHDGRTFVQFSPPYGVEFRLDLMLVDVPTFEKMRSAAECKDIFGIRSKIPCPEHLIALKLHALKHAHPERHAKDFGDVLALTRNAGLDVRSDSYRELFARFGTAEIYEEILQRLED